ncbi:cytochrome b [Agaribacterium haliotis]|uniref:cytochrome b n=1 Tax=Agaribacterium haliotis TaxID=2013869 RepID=UPI000BB561F6|nr:cytochrome b [Agaribacterium haliotis]
MKDTHQRFSHITISLHWLLALSMIAMLPFGLYIESLEGGPQKWGFIAQHKSFGVLILLIAALRFSWRLKNGFPKALSPVKNWEKALASFTHWFLLLGTLFMPISGIMMSMGGGYPVAVFGFEIIGKGEKNESLAQLGHIIHGLGGKILIALIILHIAAALKHQFIDKDGTLARMLGKTIDTQDPAN